MDVVIDEIKPIHPGKFLHKDIQASHISVRAFARSIYVDQNIIIDIIAGRRSIDRTMAIQFGHAFGSTARYWLNLQDIYDKKMALRNEATKSFDS